MPKNRNDLSVQRLDAKTLLYRDDLFPFLGGGNKARKMMALDPSLRRGGYNAIVTTGGIQSNHCRATALYCQKYSLKCTLVLHGNEEEFHDQLGNAKIIRNTGSELVFCDAEEISQAMDVAMSTYLSLGDRPYYLFGGGHTLEGGRAYIEEIEKLAKTGIEMERIFVPSGTGSTHAGILAGISKCGLDTEVIGISVGRTKQRGEAAVSEFYKRLCTSYDIPSTGKIIVDDRFLCGGYQKFNAEIEAISKSSMFKYDLPLDTTYTGKAFYGMQQILKENPAIGNVMFWYTGGIYNYFAK